MNDLYGKFYPIHYSQRITIDVGENTPKDNVKYLPKDSIPIGQLVNVTIKVYNKTLSGSTTSSCQIYLPATGSFFKGDFEGALLIGSTGNTATFYGSVSTPRGNTSYTQNIDKYILRLA